MTEQSSAPALETAPADAPAPFGSALERFRWKWRAGLLLHGLVRALLWTMVVFLALGVLDYYSGFSDPARLIAAWGIAAAAGIGVLCALGQVFFFKARDAALAADGLLATGRRNVLSALELWNPHGAAGTEKPLAHWLRTQAIQDAAARLARLRFRHPVFAKTARQVLIIVAVTAIPALLAPEAARTIARRLLHPGGDIPPYSPLRFALAPARAEVLYGGEIVITSRITGGKIDAPVHFLTRDRATHQIEDSPAYQEGPEKYSRKLEKVAAPLEVAFQAGHARSAWLPLAVRTQPKIQEVLLTVEPPAYSKLPQREFPAGAQPLAALAGSRITARVASNRPLSGGTLKLQPAAMGKAAQEIGAEKEDAHRVRFTWVLRGPARLSLVIRDVGGAASEALEFEQKATADERPQVTLRQPAGDVLATPDGELPIEGSATDDLGLVRVALVRHLNGYRERSSAEPIPPATRQYELNQKLKLAPFGLHDGQTVDLTLEAGDTNPNLLGIGTSEPAHVHIITREQYAEILRNQTTLEEFSARYEVLNQAMEDARKSLDALDAAAKSGDPAAAETARKNALEAHRKAGEIFGRIARDFPIFDLDAGLAKASQEAMVRLFENAKQLEGLWRAQPPELADALPTLKERLGQSTREMAAQLDKGGQAIAAARVFEQAGKFRELIDAQRELVQDLNRVTEEIRRGEMQAGKGLSDLAERQHANAEALASIDKELSSALAALPDAFAQLRTEGHEFLDALRELEIPPPMAKAEAAAREAQSRTADDRAAEALALLESLLRQKNGICAMCRGGGGEHFSLPEDLEQTLRQLMEALIPKPGGQGSGKTGASGGGGMGGISDSGFVMKGKMPQIPIYGPPRLRLSNRAAAGIGQGEGNGKGGGERAMDLETDRIAPPAARAANGEGLAAEAVPEAYRDAVKRYFSPEENSSSPAPAQSSSPSVP